MTKAKGKEGKGSYWGLFIATPVIISPGKKRKEQISWLISKIGGCARIFSLDYCLFVSCRLSTYTWSRSFVPLTPGLASSIIICQNYFLHLKWNCRKRRGFSSGSNVCPTQMNLPKEQINKLYKIYLPYSYSNYFNWLVCWNAVALHNPVASKLRCPPP